MRCAALVFLSFGVPCALAAGTQRRFTSESKFTDALSVLSRMTANPSSLSIALDQAGSRASNVFASGNAAGVGGAESATIGSDAAADALTNSIGSLFEDDVPNAMGFKKTAAEATVPKAPTVPMASASKAPVALKVEASKALKVNAPPPPAGPKTKAPQAPKVKAQPAPPVRKGNVPQAPPAPKANVPKVTQAPPAPKATVPKAPSAVPKAIDGTKRVVPATKHSEHSPHPKLAATSVHPGTAKKQVKAAMSKHSMMSKSVQVGKPQVAKPKPTLSKKSGSATKHTSGIGQLQPKGSIKVEELEAEVSALKAKLVTVKPLKGTLPPPHQPAAPPTIVSAATVVAKKLSAAPPPVAVNGPVAANRQPAVSSRVAALSPVTRHGGVVLEASEGQAVPAEHATVSPSKAPTPVQLPTSSVLSMTMVPIAAVAPASLTAASGPQSTSFFAAVSDWLRTMFEGRPLPAPLPAQLSPPDPNAGRPAFSTQNIAQTARSTYEDGLADVAIEDEFAQREREDAALVETVKREDRSLRLDAETPRKPSMPAPANYQHSLGSPHVSSFWGTLAEEDADIANAVSRDDYDLTEYERLTALQDDKVLTAANAINAHLGGRLGKARQAFRNTGVSAA